MLFSSTGDGAHSVARRGPSLHRLALYAAGATNGCECGWCAWRSIPECPYVTTPSIRLHLLGRAFHSRLRFANKQERHDTTSIQFSAFIEFFASLDFTSFPSTPCLPPPLPPRHPFILIRHRIFICEGRSHPLFLVSARPRPLMPCPS